MFIVLGFKLTAALIGKALAAVVLTTAFVSVLTFDYVREWFTARQSILETDRHKVAFALREALANGQRSEVLGIFDQQKGVMVDGIRVQSRALDTAMEAVHAKHQVAVFPTASGVR
jgi:hypothetical protein